MGNQKGRTKKMNEENKSLFYMSLLFCYLVFGGGISYAVYGWVGLIFAMVVTLFSAIIGILLLGGKKGNEIYN